MKKRTGILLTQLGTPKAPTVSAVRPYLREFLTDPRVIDIPAVAFRVGESDHRPFSGAQEHQNLQRTLGQERRRISPLMTITQELTNQLNERLEPHDMTVHMAMRYQEPSMDRVLEEMRLRELRQDHRLAHVSSLRIVEQRIGPFNAPWKSFRKWWVIPELEVVSQFYDADFYIDALVGQARKHNLDDYDHIIMSYHGLPERHVDKVYEGPANLCADHHCETVLDTDNKYCYKATSFETSRLIAEKLGIDESQYTVGFQSRLDKKVVTPFHRRLAQEVCSRRKETPLGILPAFVADCLETIIEIGSEYQEEFEEAGGEHVQLVESCNTEAVWVEGLTKFLLEKESELGDITPIRECKRPKTSYTPIGMKIVTRRPTPVRSRLLVRETQTPTIDSGERHLKNTWLIITFAIWCCYACTQSNDVESQTQDATVPSTDSDASLDGPDSSANTDAETAAHIQFRPGVETVTILESLLELPSPWSVPWEMTSLR